MWGGKGESGGGRERKRDRGEDPRVRRGEEIKTRAEDQEERMV